MSEASRIANDAVDRAVKRKWAEARERDNKAYWSKVNEEKYRKLKAEREAARGNQ